MARVLVQAPEALELLDIHGNVFEDRTIHRLKGAKAARMAQATETRRVYRSRATYQGGDDDFVLTIEDPALGGVSRQATRSVDAHDVPPMMEDD